MPIRVDFKNNRLFVGLRKRDQTDVWFAPGEVDNNNASRKEKKKKNTQDETELLFTSIDGKNLVWEDPSGPEVWWLPWFDPQACEADTKQKKLSMQREFLCHAYNYMKEKDEDVVAQMEEDLDMPAFRRWYVWFAAAKKEKRSRLKRRKTRSDKVSVTGISDEDIEEQVTSDVSEDENDHDSAYGEGSGGRESMAPPPRRSDKGSKRGRGMNDSNDNGRGAKRRRNDNGVRGKKGFELPLMSGARSTSLASADDDMRSDIFDTRPPPATNFGGRMTPSPSSLVTRSRVASNDVRRSTSERRVSQARSTGGRENSANDEDETMFMTPTVSQAEFQNILAYNGAGVDEDEATQRAIRASMAPETPDRDLPDPDRPMASIERDNDETMGGGVD